MWASRGKQHGWTAWNVWKSAEKSLLYDALANSIQCGIFWKKWWKWKEKVQLHSKERHTVLLEHRLTWTPFGNFWWSRITSQQEERNIFPFPQPPRGMNRQMFYWRAPKSLSLARDSLGTEVDAELEEGLDFDDHEDQYSYLRICSEGNCLPQPQTWKIWLQERKIRRQLAAMINTEEKWILTTTALWFWSIPLLIFLTILISENNI